MSISRLTKKVDALGSTWEQFKQVNDRRLSEVEKKGSADPLTIEQLGRMNSAIDGYKSRLDSVETVLNRPMGSVAGIEYGSADVNEHKQAFCGYLRKGIEDDLSHLEKKALSVGSDSDGGYLVTPSMSQNIVSAVFESSPMRQLASVETISSDSLEIIEDNDEAGAGWSAAEAAIVADSTTPDVGKKIINVHELVAQPKATQKLIDDSSVDVEAWLGGKLVDVFSRLENAAFINGNGVGKPKGILNYAAGTSWGQIEQIASGTSGEVDADSIIDLFYSLKEEYATHATFLMNRATAQQVRLLKEGSTGQYLWNPGLASGAADTLMGVPVMQAADMPTPAADSLSIALADFSRAYQIVDRTGVRILRDPFTEKPFVKFYTTKRVGGDVVNSEAIKLLKLSA
jgi:HK97 family phage major capsid protein